MFEATPPNRWERWKDRRGCWPRVALWIAVWALALLSAGLASAHIAQAVVADDWGTEQEARP